jgi:hypothetical protein
MPHINKNNHLKASFICKLKFSTMTLSIKKNRLINITKIHVNFQSPKVTINGER